MITSVPTLNNPVIFGGVNYHRLIHCLFSEEQRLTTIWPRMLNQKQRVPPTVLVY